MNYVAPDHLPLATLPCLAEQCSQCGKNFSRKPACLNEHMKKSAHLLAPGPANVKGGLVRELCCCCMGSVLGDKAQERDRVLPCIVCDKAFKSLPTRNQQKLWQHSGNLFVCKSCGKKFKPNNRYKKLVCGKPHHRKSFCNFSM